MMACMAVQMLVENQDYLMTENSKTNVGRTISIVKTGHICSDPHLPVFCYYAPEK